MARIEETILSNLINDEDYLRKVIPFIKEDYFEKKTDRILFEDVRKFFLKYNTIPDLTILRIHLEEMNIPKNEYEELKEFIEKLTYKSENKEWLLDNTEKFCKDRALYLAIMQSIHIIDGSNKELSKEALPSLLQEALSVSFDKTIGHDFQLDVESRYEFYHNDEERLPFDLESFNKITRGGLPKKTLNVALAGTNVGKSLFLCHYAASALRKGYNVLYVTLEMAEERIAERIDCNILNVNMDQLYGMTKKEYETRLNSFFLKTNGRLIIKEYPTSTAHVGHFRHLLDELRIKKNFVPDVLLIDYINICAPQRYKASANVNTYVVVKTISEELRGLAVEYNLPIISATQSNRSGSTNTDVDMTDTSESFGLPMTVDFLFAIVRTEELDELNQLMIKQLKSRYTNIASSMKRFVIGVNIDKFKLYDLEKSASDNLVKDASKTGTNLTTRKSSGISFD